MIASQMIRNMNYKKTWASYHMIDDVDDDDSDANLFPA